MKTPEEINKGLECCEFSATSMSQCRGCPYMIDCYVNRPKSTLKKDALAYIQQLERERDALEALEDNRFQYETGFVKGFEAAQPKWISVEERLPEDGVDVLVWRDGCFAIAHIITADDWTYTGIGGDPTHWMPLPQLPKEG